MRPWRRRARAATARAPMARTDAAAARRQAGCACRAQAS
ncbi:hypothetical protein AX27061_0054 [Achromobacter xylosoxidans NBRC 15126 = ATCC 27061]|nr:hypothetical protein AX27061_0054 [Achromobacter xylosoxidans NBRC 15126 = ATCC 27061]CCH06122.1 hypothetical protein NH44784_021531 [Achromobacter xylosoxidans NH44784-1996]